MVGYDSQEVPVKTLSILNVKLVATKNTLDDIVVVAFGTQKKTDMVGSITSIKPSDLKVPSSNLTTALAEGLPELLPISVAESLGRTMQISLFVALLLLEPEK